MYKYLLFLSAALSLTACQQRPKTGQHTDSTATAELPASWAKRYKGTLAGQPVTLLLQRSGPSEVRGWYTHDAHGEPISLTPDYGRPPGDSIILMEGYTQDDHTFRGMVSADGHFKGKWSGLKNNDDFDLVENNDSAIVFSLIAYEDSAKLFPSGKKSPLATVSAYTVWPTGGADEATITFLKQILHPGLKPGETAATALKNGADSFLTGYKSNAKDVDTAGMNDGPSWSWSSQGGDVVAWNQWPLLAIESWTYDFTGGAHGNGGSVFRIFDLARKKQLTMNDVFKAGHKPVLTAALDKAYRKKFNVPATQTLEEAGLFVKKIEPNNNFFITSHGAVFSYTPYEIAPYASGQISLFVPWGDIKTVVQEAYFR